MKRISKVISIELKEPHLIMIYEKEPINDGKIVITKKELKKIYNVVFGG